MLKPRKQLDESVKRLPSGGKSFSVHTTLISAHLPFSRTPSQAAPAPACPRPPQDFCSSSAGKESYRFWLGIAAQDKFYETRIQEYQDCYGLSYSEPNKSRKSFSYFVSACWLLGLPQFGPRFSWNGRTGPLVRFRVRAISKSPKPYRTYSRTSVWNFGWNFLLIGEMRRSAF